MACSYVNGYISVKNLIVFCVMWNMCDCGIIWSHDSVDVEATDHRPSVHHFARHVVCKSIAGKIAFYNALEDHLCDLSDNLRVSIVLDLCSRKDYMLDKWVAEVYDSDRDGYISHQERNYYNDE